MNTTMTNAEKKKAKKLNKSGKPTASTAATQKPTITTKVESAKVNVKSGGSPSESGKPTASSASVKKVEVAEKKKREKVEAARFPTPSAKGIPNPLLINNRNKRALCIAFAHLLGGGKPDPKKDVILVKAIREAGVLWKSGMTLENFTDETNNSHLSQAEQSGNGYAMRCGRGRHDDYMAKYPEKVDACIEFATAFLALIATEGAEYEKLRQVEIDNVDALRVEIRKLQEAEKNKDNKGPGKARKTSKKPIATKGKPSPGKGKVKATDDDDDGESDDGDDEGGIEANAVAVNRETDTEDGDGDGDDTDEG